MSSVAPSDTLVTPGDDIWIPRDDALATAGCPNRPRQLAPAISCIALPATSGVVALSTFGSKGGSPESSPWHHEVNFNQLLGPTRLVRGSPGVCFLSFDSRGVGVSTLCHCGRCCAVLDDAMPSFLRSNSVLRRLMCPGRLRLIWVLTCPSSAVAGVDASCTFLFAPTFNVYLTETPCLR